MSNMKVVSVPGLLVLEQQVTTNSIKPAGKKYNLMHFLLVQHYSSIIYHRETHSASTTTVRLLMLAWCSWFTCCF